MLHQALPAATAQDLIWLHHAKPAHLVMRVISRALILGNPVLPGLQLHGNPKRGGGRGGGGGGT